MQNADFIQSFLGGNVDVHDVVVVVVVVVVISQRMLVYCSKIRNISARFHEVDLRGLELLLLLLLLLLLFFNWSSQHIPQRMSRNRAAGVHHPGYSIYCVLGRSHHLSLRNLVRLPVGYGDRAVARTLKT